MNSYDNSGHNQLSSQSSGGNAHIPFNADSKMGPKPGQQIPGS